MQQYDKIENEKEGQESYKQGAGGFGLGAKPFSE